MTDLQAHVRAALDPAHRLFPSWTRPEESHEHKSALIAALRQLDRELRGVQAPKPLPMPVARRTRIEQPSMRLPPARRSFDDDAIVVRLTLDEVKALRAVRDGLARRRRCGAAGDPRQSHLAV